MGKSAKVHKRVPKKSKSSSSTTANLLSTAASSSRAQVQSAKKRSTLKGKAGSKDKASAGSEKGVLGGADYLSLLMGSRKKAKEEAKKLPRDD